MRLKKIIKSNQILILTLLSVATLLVILSFNTIAWADYRTLVIKPSQDTYLLGPYMEILEDPTGKLTFKQVTSPKYVDNFSPVGSSSINLAITSSTYWLRFQFVVSLENGSRNYLKTHHWIFDPTFILPTRVNWQLFEKEKDSAIFEHLSNSHTYYQIPCLSNIFRTYYLKINSTTLITFKPQIINTSTYIKKRKFISLFQGTYFGIILAVAFYLLATFRSLKESSHLWYVLHIVTLACYFFLFNGLSADYLPQNFQDQSGLVARGLLCLSLAFAACFARSTLKQKKDLKLTYLSYSYLIVAFIFISILNFFLPSLITNIALCVLGITGAIIGIFAAASYFQSKNKISIIFVLAWFFFLMGGLAFALSFSGILPYNLFLLNGFQIASAVSAILFAMALETHITALQKAKVFSQRNEGRIKSILDSIQSGVLIIESKSSKILEVNLKALETINAPINEVINTNWRKYIWPADALIDSLEKKDSRQKKDHEHYLSTHDGKEIPVICEAKPITLNNQKLLLLSFIDITAQRKTEEEKAKLIKELSKALANIKKLSGLLPICANCKKIRDDKGYWNQIEEYLSEHSDIDFSHSICPECAQELYPELGDIYSENKDKSS